MKTDMQYKTREIITAWFNVYIKLKSLSDVICAGR